jgi:hypothetical protein
MFWDDKAPIYYLGENNKNKDLVHIGAKVIIEKELGGEIKFLGYAEVKSVVKDEGKTSKIEYNLGKDKDNQTNEGYNIYFKNYVKFKPPRTKSNEIRRKLNSLPDYHWTDSVRPLTKEIYYEIVNSCLEENWGLYLDEIPPTDPAIRPLNELLSEEESERLEFKSSMLHPHKSSDKIIALESELSKASGQKKDELLKKLEAAKSEQPKLITEEIIIGIASFMNSRGGTLLVGIDDNKKIIGIEYDYGYHKIKDWDDWSLYLKDKLKSYIKVEDVRKVKINPHFTDDGKTIARIDVRMSLRYAFVKIQNNENFYIRYNNSEDPLKGESMVNYIIDRWKEIS